MTSVNTGPDGCPLSKSSLAAIDNLSNQLGEENDLFGDILIDTKCAHIEAMEFCGRVCTSRGICLGINPQPDRETLIVREYINIFEIGSKIGTNCEANTD